MNENGKSEEMFTIKKNTYVVKDLLAVKTWNMAATMVKLKVNGKGFQKLSSHRNYMVERQNENFSPQSNLLNNIYNYISPHPTPSRYVNNVRSYNW